MDYITSEQFLQQPEKVQKVLKEWWYGNNPSRFDVVSYDDGDYRYNTVLQELTKYPHEFCTLDNLENGKLIPCFDEGKLRKFIEDKTGYKMITVPFINDADIPCIDVRFKDMNIGKLIHESICVETSDPLQAYWQVVCKIAGE